MESSLCVNETERGLKMQKMPENIGPNAGPRAQCNYIWGGRGQDGENVYNNMFKNNDTKGVLSRGASNEISDIDIMSEIHRVCQKQVAQSAYQPISYRFNPELDEMVLDNCLGKKKKYNLSELIRFCCAYSEYTKMGAPTSVAISPTHSRMRRNFQTMTRCRNIISLAQECGLIKKVEGDGVNCYVWNPTVVELLKNKAKELKIEEPIVTYHVRDTGRRPKPPKGCMFKISPEPSEHSVIWKYDDKVVRAGLYRDYPQLEKYQSMVDEYNRSAFVRENPFLGMTFEPHITRSKTGRISKIGIRVTSPFANSHSSRNIDYREQISSGFHSVGKVSRESLLDCAFGFLACEEEDSYLDIKASVPRVTAALNTGRWNCDNDFDYYREMFGRVYDKLNRSDWKRLFMYLYFTLSEKKIRSRMVMKGFDVSISPWLEDFLWRGKSSMEQSIGRTYGSEIFLHESCIYIGAIDRLRRMGFNVGLVYDAFYFSKDSGLTKEMVSQAISDSFDEYYAKYIVRTV